MSFLTGYLTLSVKHETQNTISIRTRVAQIKDEFVRENQPYLVLGLSSFPGGEVSNTLLDPSEVLPQTEKYHFNQLQNLLKFSKTCEEKYFLKSRAHELEKAWLWEKFKCAKDKNILPNDFFEYAPFIHPFGSSYVKLALDMPDLFPASDEFIHNNLRYMHISELRFLPASKLSKNLSVISSLSLYGQKSFLDHNEFILDESFVFVSQHLPSSENHLTEEFSSYLVFKRKVWNDFIKSSSLVATVSDINGHCQYQEDSTCWSENTEAFYKRFKRLSIAMAFASFLLTIIAGLLAVKKFKDQKKADEKKRFALQTLTHELRTPLASLILSSETLLNKFDQIESSVQNDVLRICNDVQKLKRLTDISKQYLQSHSEKGFIQFKPQNISRLNQYVENVLEPYLNRISFKPLDKDRVFSLDPYWVGLCLKNLVENALLHGGSPVQVVMQMKDQELVITVEDAGTFSNGVSKNPGLGLGLSIVKQVLKEMKGQLLQETNPTRFILKLKDVR